MAGCMWAVVWKLSETLEGPLYNAADCCGREEPCSAAPPGQLQWTAQVAAEGQGRNCFAAVSPLGAQIGCAQISHLDPRCARQAEQGWGAEAVRQSLASFAAATVPSPLVVVCRQARCRKLGPGSPWWVFAVPAWAGFLWPEQVSCRRKFRLPASSFGRCCGEPVVGW
jgi:hypothetical protein